MPPIKAAFAEFVGTFALTFIGAGAIIMNAAMPNGGSGLVGVALAHGLILAVMVSATMHISGGQINPAVSVGLAVIRKQPWTQAGVFIVAQVAGAVIAALLLKTGLSTIPAWDGIDSAVESVKVGATLGDPRYAISAGTTYGLEAICTFFLMFVVMGTAVDGRGVGRTMAVGGFAIGLTLAACILFIGPLTGAALNPARSFGPALVAGAWDLQLIYWIGPITGAVMAAMLYEKLFGSETS